MKKDLIYIAFIILIFSIAFNDFNEKNNTIEKHKKNIEALKDSTSYYKNKQGEIVATKLALQLTKVDLANEKKSNKRLKIAISNYKKTIAVVQSTQVVKIDNIKIPYKTEIPLVFNRFKHIKEKYYSLDLISNNKGLEVSNFKITENNQDLVIGYKKKSFFGNSELRAEITNTNPLFVQKNIKPIVIVYKKSWYEKPSITIPIGFVIGLLAQ